MAGGRSTPRTGSAGIRWASTGRFWWIWAWWAAAVRWYRPWRASGGRSTSLSRSWRRPGSARPCAGRWGGAGQQPLRIRDYGAGKGYLTFALHDHLTHQLGLQVETVGVERRADLVALCNRLAQKNGMAGLRFEKGDILRAGDAPQGLQEGQEGLQGLREDVHVIIALHACDTATDDALWQGIRQQAAMLVCSPCCHRELRPQLQAPAPLTALLRHGIHLGLEAEMLTDGLRALLLETQGYEAQVFEFISPDDTGKNRMILGCRTGRARPAAEARAEIDALKAFYGIRHQRLDALLQASDGLSPS